MDDLKIFAKTEKEITGLLNVVKIFSNDICMEFGLDKCAIMRMKRGVLQNGDSVELYDGEKIDPLSSNGYKYLDILENTAIIKHTTMKQKIGSDNTNRLRKILKSKLNGYNIIRAINSRALPVITCSAGIVNWSDENLKQLDREKRKKKHNVWSVFETI